MIEQKCKPQIASCQPAPLNRLIRAVAHVSQARLLVLQERRDVVGANRAKEPGENRRCTLQFGQSA